MKNLLRVGILTLFALLAIGGASSYLESASGANLAADISSILGRAASGIFNSAGTSEKFIGAVSLNSDDNERGSTSLTAPEAPRVKQKININTATFGDLQEITGVGPVTAQKIIDYRNANGIFYKIEDIQKVNGIGPATFEKMKSEITVGSVVRPLSTSPAPESVPKEQYRDIGYPDIGVGESEQSTTPDSLVPSNEIEAVNENVNEPIDALKNERGSTSLININTAKSAELQDITGVGPAIAQRIIEYRKTVSPFYKIEDIKKVSGIGEAKFDKMKSQITVGNITPLPIQLEPSSAAESPALGQAEAMPGRILGLLAPSGDGGQIGTAPTAVSESPTESPPPPPPPEPEESGNDELNIEDSSKSELVLNYPQNVYTNEEFSVGFNAGNIQFFLPNKLYDIKIFIYTDSISNMSDVYNKKEDKWQSSFYYISGYLSKDNASDLFRMRIRENYKNFSGDAFIGVRIRESGESSYLDIKNNIKIATPINTQTEAPQADEESAENGTVTDTDFECIDINTSPEEELVKIIHMTKTWSGETYAQQVIRLRQESLFTSVDDLVRVNGIGTSRLKDIKDEGLACVL